MQTISGDFCKHPHHPSDCRVILNYPTKCWHCDRVVVLYQCERAGPVVLEPPDKGAHIPEHCKNPPENEGDTPLSPLIYPARDGDIEQINRLGQSPNMIAPWINRGDKNGRTSLFFAAENGHAKAIQALARIGESPRQTDKNGRTPLIVAAMHGQVEAVRALVALGVDHHWQDRDGKAPLDYAVELNAPGAVAALAELERVSDMPNFLRAAVDALGSTLRPDQRRDRSGTIKILHGLGADFEKADEKGRRPIHLAAEAGSWTAAEALAKCGVSLEAACGIGFTPMHWAAHGNYARVISVLVDHGALVNSQTGDGETPLDWANKKNARHAIQELKRRGGKEKEEL